MVFFYSETYNDGSGQTLLGSGQTGMDELAGSFEAAGLPALLVQDPVDALLQSPWVDVDEFWGLHFKNFVLYFSFWVHVLLVLVAFLVLYIYLCTCLVWLVWLVFLICLSCCCCQPLKAVAVANLSTLPNLSNLSKLSNIPYLSNLSNSSNWSELYNTWLVFTTRVILKPYGALALNCLTCLTCLVCPTRLTCLSYIINWLKALTAKVVSHMGCW